MSDMDSGDQILGEQHTHFTIDPFLWSKTDIYPRTFSLKKKTTAFTIMAFPTVSFISFPLTNFKAIVLD